MDWPAYFSALLGMLTGFAIWDGVRPPVQRWLGRRWARWRTRRNARH